MTRMPFCYTAHALLRITRPVTPVRFASMAAEAHTNASQVQPENAPPTLANYPVPLSPPPTLLSKDVELNRALTASSKSSLFSLSRNDVLFEDDWLIAVNKPQGIYCESILTSVRILLSPDQGSLIPNSDFFFYTYINFIHCLFFWTEL